MFFMFSYLLDTSDDSNRTGLVMTWDTYMRMRKHFTVHSVNSTHTSTGTTIIKTTRPETTSFSAQLRNERDYNASNMIREVKPKAAKAYCTRFVI